MRNIKSWVLFVPLFAILFSVLSPAFSASAASVYDNTIQVWNNPLEIKSASNNHVRDITNDWVDLFNASASCTSGGYQDSYATALANGDWYQVITRENGSSNPMQRFYLVWQETESLLPATFTTYGSSNRVLNSNFTSPKFLSISLSNSNVTDVGCATGNPGTIGDQIANERVSDGFGIVYPVLFTGDIVYPSGYEGVDVPDEPIVERVPSFGWYVTDDLRLNVTYLRNLDVPQPCTFGYSLYQADGNFDYDDESEPLDYQSRPLIEMYQYKLPAVGNYVMVISPQICVPMHPDNIKDIPTVIFKINADGTFHKGSNVGLSDCIDNICEPDEIDLLESCFTENIPYINFQGCITNLGRILSMLSFGAITFNNTWEIAPNCQSLSVLDDWLGLDNPYVCPMFPEYVRTIVTPFITFLLGLVMVRFISRQGGDNF